MVEGGLKEYIYNIECLIPLHDNFESGFNIYVCTTVKLVMSPTYKIISRLISKIFPCLCVSAFDIFIYNAYTHLIDLYTPAYSIFAMKLPRNTHYLHNPRMRIISRIDVAFHRAYLALVVFLANETSYRDVYANRDPSNISGRCMQIEAPYCVVYDDRDPCNTSGGCNVWKPPVVYSESINYRVKNSNWSIIFHPQVNIYYQTSMANDSF